jgi:hypothetical protein
MPEFLPNLAGVAECLLKDRQLKHWFDVELNYF